MLDKSLQKSAVTRNWLLQLHDVVIHSPALDSTISAFFAAQVGRINNDVNLVHQGRSMYVDGLKHFQQAPTHPQDRPSDETLAACMALSMYELTECPPGTQSAYVTHQRGGADAAPAARPGRMCFTAGPKPISEPPNANSESFPSQVVTSTKRPWPQIADTAVHPIKNFLSHPEWIERPWKLVSKSVLDELVDVHFDYQTVLQQSHKLSREPNQDLLQDGLRDIIAKSLKLDSTFRDLYAKFEKSVSGLLYWPELSTLKSLL